MGRVQYFLSWCPFEHIYLIQLLNFTIMWKQPQLFLFLLAADQLQVIIRTSANRFSPQTQRLCYTLCIYPLSIPVSRFVVQIPSDFNASTQVAKLANSFRFRWPYVCLGVWQFGGGRTFPPWAQVWALMTFGDAPLSVSNIWYFFVLLYIYFFVAVGQIEVLFIARSLLPAFWV